MWPGEVFQQHSQFYSSTVPHPDLCRRSAQHTKVDRTGQQPGQFSGPAGTAMPEMPEKLKTCRSAKT